MRGNITHDESGYFNVSLVYFKVLSHHSPLLSHSQDMRFSGWDSKRVLKNSKLDTLLVLFS
jgi:hypothetical protein